MKDPLAFAFAVAVAVGFAFFFLFLFFFLLLFSGTQPKNQSVCLCVQAFKAARSPCNGCACPLRG